MPSDHDIAAELAETARRLGVDRVLLQILAGGSVDPATSPPAREGGREAWDGDEEGRESSARIQCEEEDTKRSLLEKMARESIARLRMKQRRKRLSKSPAENSEDVCS